MRWKLFLDPIIEQVFMCVCVFSLKFLACLPITMKTQFSHPPPLAPLVIRSEGWNFTCFNCLPPIPPPHTHLPPSTELYEISMISKTQNSYDRNIPHIQILLIMITTFLAWKVPKKKVTTWLKAFSTVEWWRHIRWTPLSPSPLEFVYLITATAPTVWLSGLSLIVWDDYIGLGGVLSDYMI